MAKKIKTIIKLTIPAAAATPAPPVGPALGQAGVPIMDFVNAFNERTKEQKGSLIPAVITVYEDRSFDFIIKKPPVSDLLKKKTGLSKGSGSTHREKIATLTRKQIEEIAQTKLPDLNTTDIEAAKRTVIGTARSMGIEIID